MQSQLTYKILGWGGVNDTNFFFQKYIPIMVFGSNKIFI